MLLMMMIGKRNCARLTESNFDCANKYRYLPNETFGFMNNDLPNSVMTLPLKVLTQRVGQLNVKFCEAERWRNAPGRDLEVRSATKRNRPLKGSAANCLLKRCLLPGAGPSKGSNTPRTHFPLKSLRKSTGAVRADQAVAADPAVRTAFVAPPAV